MTQVSPSTARATRSWKTSTGTSVQFGPHASASSSTCSTLSRRANSRANVVFPEPVDPTTEMRFSPKGRCESDRASRLRLLFSRPLAPVRDRRQDFLQDISTQDRITPHLRAQKLPHGVGRRFGLLVWRQLWSPALHS